MRRDLLRTVVLCLASSLAGGIGWSGIPDLLPAAMTLPLFWSRAPSRLSASLVAASYFMTAARGLPMGIATYFSQGIWLGFLLCAAASFCFALVHGVLWVPALGIAKALRYAIVLLLTGLPPFGVVGWGHPLTAAGILFPGFGWFGFGLATIGLLLMATRWSAGALASIACVWILSVAVPMSPPLAPDWQGISLHLGPRLGRESSLAYQRQLIAIVTAEAESGAKVVILPESVLGLWTPSIERLWTNALAKLSNVIVVAGASIVERHGYANVMMTMTPSGSQVLYRQRMPVPLAMWQPWSFGDGSTGVEAGYFANPVIDIAGKRVAPVICYEQFLLWPIVQSLLFSPDVIVLIGNDWWANNTNIPDIQQVSAISWARLFNLPLVSAVNH